MIAIAIDGPAGAGKSTVARQAAKRLGYIYVDTGALYRTIGLHIIRLGISLDDQPSIAENVPKDIRLEFKNGEQRVILCGEDVSAKIRTPEVSMAASAVSAVPRVREALLGLQKQLARDNNVIMDGRDIGTVVIPDAQIKIFLTASAEQRAKRRCLELEQKGINTDFNQVLEEMKQRDYNDYHREIAPLKPADDSIILDTSSLSLHQSIEALLDIIKEKLTETS